MKKHQYLLRSVARFNTKKHCPYCMGSKSKVVDRKFFVTTLNECSDCKLLFRHPVDTVEFNHKFYQEEYEQNDGMTTDLPSEDELGNLMAANFVGTTRDFTGKINTIKSLLDARVPTVVDYGANWGYTSYQFKQAGCNVQSYEISVPRANYGKKLGLEILTNEKQLKKEVDVFFNSHVIEHLPSIKNMFLLAQSLLKNEGLFVAYCPNGSEEFREKQPEIFHRFWGQVHPNYLSASFFANVFKDVPYLLGSENAPTEDVLAWNRNSQKTLDLSGSELFVFAKLKHQVL
ncbi:MAG: methyltransferase domain-containing protein [Chitinophagaceae bacterium]|nr:MAG: methyltransferase domain-containing protein [Chitinophagaceae bacterium]